MGKWKTKPPVPYTFACELKVPAYGRIPGLSCEGGRRWTWALDGGPATTECGYRCFTEDQFLVHVIVTHRIPAQAARRRMLATVIA